MFCLCSSAQVIQYISHLPMVKKTTTTATNMPITVGSLSKTPFWRVLIALSIFVWNDIFSKFHVNMVSHHKIYFVAALAYLSNRNAVTLRLSNQNRLKMSWFSHFQCRTGKSSQKRPFKIKCLGQQTYIGVVTRNLQDLFQLAVIKFSVNLLSLYYRPSFLTLYLDS